MTRSRWAVVIAAGASQTFRSAVARQQSLAEALDNLAVTRDRMGDRAEARKHCLTVANLGPGHKVIRDSPPLRETGLIHNVQRKSFSAPNPRGRF